jgi:hypothetical protein
LELGKKSFKGTCRSAFEVAITALAFNAMSAGAMSEGCAATHLP